MSIELVALTPELAEALAAGDLAFYGEAPVDPQLARTIADMARMQAELYRRTNAQAPWIGYLARDPGQQAIVGGCSFVGHDGRQVEIAYFTFPGLEGRGVATGMARALLDLAWDDPELETVIAHTLPQDNASTAILRKLGFEQNEDAFDADVGRVWLWKRGRP